MLSRKDYIKLSEIMGDGFAAAYNHSGEDGRTVFYDSVYSPLVRWLADDNPSFDLSRFSYATAVREGMLPVEQG